MKRSGPHQLDLPLRFPQRQIVGRAHLALEGRLVSYTIKRSARRRAISILVDEQGLRVGAPWNAPQNTIERLLRKHAAWVLRKLDEWHVRRPPLKQWGDGEQLMLLGRAFTVCVAPHITEIGIQDTDLLVPAAAATGTNVCLQVQEWLHTQALLCFEERVAHYAELLGIERKPQVLLSNARTRWGSCHSSGRIHLNWRLVQMPVDLIDYVVAHEVAHLLEMNHSQRFWRVVGRVVPDYAARRKTLRHHGHRYLVL